jgi:hypothetical protein
VRPLASQPASRQALLTQVAFLIGRAGPHEEVICGGTDAEAAHLALDHATKALPCDVSFWAAIIDQAPAAEAATLVLAARTTARTLPKARASICRMRSQETRNLIASSASEAGGSTSRRASKMYRSRESSAVSPTSSAFSGFGLFTFSEQRFLVGTLIYQPVLPIA